MYDPVRYYTLTLASAATSTDASQRLDAGYKAVYLETPASMNADLYVQAAFASTGTFKRITQTIPNTTSVQVYDYRIASSASSKMIPIPPGFDFYKVEVSTAIADGATFRIICS